jgi:hypothetical protein
MGQAAGTAAALAVRQRIPPRRVAVRELQATLIGQQAYLGDRVAAELHISAQDYSTVG